MLFHLRRIQRVSGHAVVKCMERLRTQLVRTVMDVVAAILERKYSCKGFHKEYWQQFLPKQSRECIFNYLRTDSSDFSWDLVKALWNMDFDTFIDMSKVERHLYSQINNKRTRDARKRRHIWLWKLSVLNDVKPFDYISRYFLQPIMKYCM